MNEKLEQAIEQLRVTAGRYRRARRYYAGLHDLSFATEKFANTFGEMFREFALNLCPAVVDATRDKLKIKGFGIDSTSYAFTRESAGGGGPSSGQTGSNAGGLTPKGVTLAVGRIWNSNKLAIRAGEVHKEALRCGDAYLIVWPGADGVVQIVPNAADTMTVKYDEEVPGRILWAAKYWRTADKRTRLNLYFADRIEKYISKDRGEGVLPDAKSFVPFGARRQMAGTREVQQLSLFDGDSSAEARPPVTTGGSDSVVQNPYGIVPVFHFANNADIGEFGRSELEAAMPVQDGLNKSVLDMLVAMEVSAFRQRWAAGIEIQLDPETGKEIAPFRSGLDTLWLTESPDAKFGDFAATELEQFLKVKDGFRIDIASVTGTPLYYLMPHTRAVPSGESLRKAETRFLAKVRDRQEQFGAVWAEAMSFALKIAGHPGVSLVTHWEDPAPTSERETLENLRIKKELGISTEQALKEAGYGDVEARRIAGEGLATDERG
jgi:hypothetical protein